MVIVIPTFKQGQFIEETLRSILLQGYPDIQLIVKDGGSPDNTVDIIRKYDEWIDKWTSQKDGGQVYAINEGFKGITGDIANWINSDDVLVEGALQRIANAYKGGPVVGSILKGYDVSATSEEDFPSISARQILLKPAIPQPAIWMPIQAIKIVGPISTDLNYAFDIDYLIRIFAASPPPTFTNCALVFFRLHQASKSVTHPGRFEIEIRRILTKWSRQNQYPELKIAAARSGRKVRYRVAVRRAASSTKVGYVSKLYFFLKILGRWRYADRFIFGAIFRHNVVALGRLRKSA